MKPRLYLDIDGVLNCKEGDTIAKENFPKDFELLDENLLKHKFLLHKHWHVPSVRALKRILDTVKPEVYIHSTWKHHFEIDDLKAFFDYWDLDSDLIVGIVPQYKFSSARYHDLSWHIDGDRIQEDDQPKCENYVVIDDLDMTKIFEETGVFKDQIVTSAHTGGLKEEHADRAIELLQGGSDG